MGIAPGQDELLREAGWRVPESRRDVIYKRGQRGSEGLRSRRGLLRSLRQRQPGSGSCREALVGLRTGGDRGPRNSVVQPAESNRISAYSCSKFSATTLPRGARIGATQWAARALASDLLRKGCPARVEG